VADSADTLQQFSRRPFTSEARTSSIVRWLFVALVAALLLVRLPSLVQPAGGDQSIYAYMGQAILAGEVPYRDAWDQKPPGIHFTYAALLGLWHRDAVVALADLVAAALVAWLLVPIGRRITGRAGAGECAAVVFLLLGDPSFQRLGGVWIRGQSEAFIALVVTAGMLVAFLATASASERGQEARAFLLSVAAGVLLGAAFVYKYNAGIYLLPGLLVYLVAVPSDTARDPRNRGAAVLVRQQAAVVLGFLLLPCIVALWFAWRGALGDLYQATIVYNVGYSGETYDGAWGALRFLLLFPVKHAQVDALWFLGGVGCALLLPLATGNRRLVVVPAWVAAACISIAVNGGRGLPQYFVQAAPALALGAGIGAMAAWRALGPIARAALFIVLVVAVVRVNQFDKWAANVAYDLDHALGRTPREQYLAKFGGQRQTDKFSALATAQLGDRLRAESKPGDRVLVLGFSAGALVQAERQSATRFFWSRPLLVGFNEGRPGYGASGLLDELKRWRPPIVALQQHDWPAEGVDSATWFARQPALQEWLADGYRLEADTGMFFVWRRKDQR
jgi:hypothetical protein